MADVEALDAIQSQDLERWRAYIASLTDEDAQIDLRQAVIKNVVLVGFSFAHCNFVGARIEGALFVDCIFAESEAAKLSASNCTFRNCSVVDSFLKDIVVDQIEMFNCAIVGCSIDYLRGSVAFSNVEIRNSHFRGLQLERCRWIGGVAAKLEGDRCEIKALEVEGVSLLEVDLRDLELGTGSARDIRIDRSRITRVTVSGGVENTTIIDSKIESPTFLGTVRTLDARDSWFSNLEVSSLDLPSARLLGCSFVAASWPRMRLLPTGTGELRHASSAPLQPVQDLRGVPPQIRREIADFQYVASLYANSSRSSRILLRAWGITSAWGQSLWRLAFATLYCWAILLITHLAETGHLVGDRFDTGLMAGAASATTLSLAGISAYDPAGLAPLSSFAARATGILLLGLWIGVAANRLAKLSAE